MSTAACQFCSLPDDSIQVICDARCLLCSRCQIVPIVRKLLVDHTEFATTPHLVYNTPTMLGEPVLTPEAIIGNTTQYYAVKGTCPLCESPMSASMLAMVQSYWDAMKQQLEEEAGGKSSAAICLEETSPLIPAFLKRFRAIYEQSDNKPTSDLESDNLGLGKLGKSKASTTSNDALDLMSQTKTNLHSVQEFVLECYCLQWQSILKNSNDSMLTTVFKASNKKKFSQRTNDMKSKAILDFLASSSANEIPELLLFNHQIGLLPKPTTKISPGPDRPIPHSNICLITVFLVMLIGWGNIVTSIMVMTYCDKCLKKDSIHDAYGEPSVGEFRTKLFKSFHMQYNKNISIKKCLKILKLFITSRHVYWNMLPLSSACVEYNALLPWSKESISKLMNILLYVANFENMHLRRPGTESTNFNNVRFHASVEIDKVDSASVADKQGTLSPSTNHRNSISTAAVSIEGKSNISSPTISRRSSFVNSHSTPSGSKPGTANKRGSVSTSSQEQNNLSVFLTNFSQATTSQNNTIAPLNNLVKNKAIVTRMDMLKCLDSIIDRVWNTTVAYHVNLDNAREEDDHSVDYRTLRSIEEVLKRINGYDNVESEKCIVELDYDNCQTLGENTFISLTDFSFLMLRCWEAEYSHIRHTLSKGAVAVQRRNAIAGSYDPNRAVLTAGEKLCIVRLLHYYSIKGEFRGVDWDEVLSLGTGNGKFPFTIPDSILQKSHNELNFLVDKVTKMLLEQKEHDELEDIKSHGRALVNSYASSTPDHTSDLYNLIEEMTIAPIPEGLAEDEESTLGGLVHQGDGIEHTRSRENTPSTPFRGERGSVVRMLNKTKKAMSLQFTTGELHDIMSSTTTTTNQLASKPTLKGFRNASQTFSVEEMRAFHSEVEAKLREHESSKARTIDDVSDRIVPKRMQSPSPAQMSHHNLEKNRVRVDYINQIPTGELENFRPKSRGDIDKSKPGSKGDNAKSKPSSRESTGLRKIQHSVHNNAMPHMVDILDNDGDVLNNSFVMSLSRPLSGHHLHQEHLKTHDNIRLNSREANDQDNKKKSLEQVKTNIEETVESFLPLSMATNPRRYNSKTLYKIHLEQGSSIDGRPILQVHIDQDRLANNADIFEELANVDRSLQQAVQVEETYQRQTLVMKNKRASEARMRILSRATQSGTLTADQFEQLAGAVKSQTNFNAVDTSPSKPPRSTLLKPVMPLPALLSKSSREDSINSLSTSTSSVITPGLVLPYLYLSPYLNNEGKLTLDINNNLYSESVVYFIDIQQSFLSMENLSIIAKTFLKPAQLSLMKVLDLSYNPTLGSAAAQLISKYFSRCCHLIHLNFNQMQMGEVGFKALLESIVSGGGGEHMLRLDLQSNCISLATDAFEYFRHFKVLKALDLANNQFTLDTHLQLSRFVHGMKGLSSLTALSLAFNKIQDNGFVSLVDLLLRHEDISHTRPVKKFSLHILDVTACFITSNSEAAVINLLEANSHKPTAENASSSQYLSPNAKETHKDIYNSAVTRQDTSMSALTLPSMKSDTTPITPSDKKHLATSESAPQLKSGRPPVKKTLTRLSTNTMIKTVLNSFQSGNQLQEEDEDANAFAELPITKLYVGGNLFNPTNIKDIQRRYHLMSKCELILNDAHIEVPLVHRTYKQRKYMSDVPDVSYSQIHNVKSYDLRDYKIVVNRDAAKLM